MSNEFYKKYKALFFEDDTEPLSYDMFFAKKKQKMPLVKPPPKFNDPLASDLAPRHSPAKVPYYESPSPVREKLKKNTNPSQTNLNEGTRAQMVQPKSTMGELLQFNTSEKPTKKQQPLQKSWDMPEPAQLLPQKSSIHDLLQFQTKDEPKQFEKKRYEDQRREYQQFQNNRHDSFKPKAEPYRPPRAEEYRPKVEEYRPPKPEEYRPKMEEYKPPRAEEYRPKVEEYRPPRAEEYRPKVEEYRPPRAEEYRPFEDFQRQAEFKPARAENNRANDDFRGNNRYEEFKGKRFEDFGGFEAKQSSLRAGMDSPQPMAQPKRLPPLNEASKSRVFPPPGPPLPQQSKLNPIQQAKANREEQRKKLQYRKERLRDLLSKDRIQLVKYER